MKNRNSKIKDKKKGFDVPHKEQIPDIPKEIIRPPKEATDPSESLKHA